MEIINKTDIENYGRIFCVIIGELQLQKKCLFCISLRINKLLKKYMNMFLVFSKPISKHICICIKYLILKALLDLKYQYLYTFI